MYEHLRLGTLAADTQRLIDTLYEMNPPIGTVIPWQALEEIGQRPQQNLMSILRTVKMHLSARRHFYQTVRGSGWIRVNDALQAKLVVDQQHKNARQTRVVLKQTQPIDRGALTMEERTQYDTQRSLLALVVSMSSQRVTNSLKTVCEMQERALHPREGLEALQTIFRKK